MFHVLFKITKRIICIDLLSECRYLRQSIVISVVIEVKCFVAVLAQLLLQVL